MTSRIDDLQRLHEAATKGEWGVHGMGGVRTDGTRDGGYCVMHGPLKIVRSPVGPGNGLEQQRDDMHAIVALHNAWPAIHRVLVAAREFDASAAAHGLVTIEDIRKLREALRALDDKEQLT